MKNVLVSLSLALFLLPAGVQADSELTATGPTHGAEPSPIATPLVAPTPEFRGGMNHTKAHRSKIHKLHPPIMPIQEIQAALHSYIARTEGDDKGLVLLGRPKMGACAASEVCDYIWYLQKFSGPHGEIGGEAIITSTLKRPSIYSVVTLAAGAADSIEGFAAFEVPASAAQSLLRPTPKIVPSKSKFKKHPKLKRKMHGLGIHSPKPVFPDRGN